MEARLPTEDPVMSAPRNALIAPLLAYASRLRFPWLFGIMLVLFVVNLFVVDPIPLVDEVLLGLFALLLGTIRRKRDKTADPEPKTIDISGD